MGWVFGTTSPSRFTIPAWALYPWELPEERSQPHSGMLETDTAPPADRLSTANRQGRDSHIRTLILSLITRWPRANELSGLFPLIK